MEKYDENIENIKGIGPKKAQMLNNAGVNTIGELLNYFPLRYDFYNYYADPNEIRENSKVVFNIVYTGGALRKYAPSIGYYVRWQCRLGEKMLMLTWFNQPYMVNSLVKGKKYCVKCDITCKGNLLSAVNPHFTSGETANESIIEPVYGSSSGISSSQIHTFVKNAIDYAGDSVSDNIPEDILAKYDVPNIKGALKSVHCPQNEADCIKGMRRFIFEEFFMFKMRQLISRKQIENEKAQIKFDFDDIERFFETLPFALTSAQMRAVREIGRDMLAEAPMNRLVQGDVGSGKTIVAFAACLMAKLGGMQSVIMVPTEVLARQHMESFQKLFKNCNISAALLVGGLKASEKNYAKKAFEENKIDVLIGTQAILEGDVASDNVGLVITDEQHRFGVRQRLGLKNKGKPVNMLVLTATPIPRTLSMVVYSDLDISVIDELPPGRIPIKTYSVKSSMRERVYKFVMKEISAGRQAYVICPSVEDEDKASVKEFYTRLSTGELKGARCAMLYGGMKPQDKETVMNKFAARELDVIISTTVIEVGINVPNATVIVIENAERFGLAQLHQLRGRVGRGEYKSHCVLISDSETDIAKARLITLTKTNDGFEIAEEDMRLRGAGEYFGLRQHGSEQFRYGELPRDAKLFAAAADAAKLVQSNSNLYGDFYTSMYEKAQKLNDRIVFN